MIDRTPAPPEPGFLTVHGRHALVYYGQDAHAGHASVRLGHGRCVNLTTLILDGVHLKSYYRPQNKVIKYVLGCRKTVRLRHNGVIGYLSEV